MLDASAAPPAGAPQCGSGVLSRDATARTLAYACAAQRPAQTTGWPSEQSKTLCSAAHGPTREQAPHCGCPGQRVSESIEKDLERQAILLHSTSGSGSGSALGLSLGGVRAKSDSLFLVSCRISFNNARNAKMAVPFNAFSFLTDVVSINDLVLPAFPAMYELFLQRYGREPKPVEFIEHAAVGYVNLSNCEIIMRDPDQNFGFSTFDEYIKAFKQQPVNDFVDEWWAAFRARLDDPDEVMSMRESYAEYYRQRLELCDTVDILSYFRRCHRLSDKVLFKHSIAVSQQAALWGVEQAIGLAVENHVATMVIVFPAKISAYFDETVELFRQRLRQYKTPECARESAFVSRFQVALDAIARSFYVDGGDFSRLLKLHNGVFTLFQTHTRRRLNLIDLLLKKGIDAIRMDDQELTDLLLNSSELMRLYVKSQQKNMQVGSEQIFRTHSKCIEARVEKIDVLELEKQASRFPLFWNPAGAYTCPPGHDESQKQ